MNQLKEKYNAKKGNKTEMINLETFVGKRVVIVDTDNRTWVGVVDEYNPDDDFLDYEGESIDVVVENSPYKGSNYICFAKSDIQSIKEQTEPVKD